MNSMQSEVVFLLTLVKCVLCVPSSAYPSSENYGNSFQSGEVLIETGPVILIQRDVVLPTGNVTAFHAYFGKTENSDLYFQIWRPVQRQISSSSFSLIHQMMVKDPQPGNFTLPIDDGMTTVEGDRLAFLTTGRKTPLIAQFRSGMNNPVYFKSLSAGTRAFIGETIEFDSLQYPYTFSISVDIKAGGLEDEKPIFVLGPPGSTGPKGEPGATGATGYIGPTGASGVPGRFGATGAPGVVGATGPIGSTGATGSPGLEGPIGWTGPVGSPGTVGTKGERGSIGIPGPDGPIGETGIPGKEGKQGETGFTGPQGATGWTGSTGQPGFRGHAGATGATGATGVPGTEIGATGQTGATGIRGHTGFTGPPGPAGPMYVDIDDCAADLHHCEQRCENVLGSYKCSCRPGYLLQADLHSCKDMDECSTNNGGCQFKCVNLEGSYLCDCPPGLKLSANKHTCEDIRECDVNNGGCHGNNKCLDTWGGHVCLLDEATIAPDLLIGSVKGVLTKDELLNRHMIIGLITWLCLLTGIVLLILFCICARRIRENRLKRKYLKADSLRHSLHTDKYY